MYFEQLFLIFLLITCVVVNIHSLERNLSWVRNPECDRNASRSNACAEATLVYVAAEGPNDTLHYVWGFVGRPTLLLALTEPGVNLTINWDSLLFGPADGSIGFTGPTLYSFGFAINRILEFRDVNDTANLEQVPDFNMVSLAAEYFDWSLESLGRDKDGSLVLEMRAGKYDDGNISRTGNVSFMMSGYGRDGHGAHLPHLLHSANCSQLEVTLQGMETSPHFEGQSRFALELLLASSEELPSPGATLTQHRSLDDEHTPGVFTVVDLLTPLTLGKELGGFLQWRPVAYTQPKRDIESSTETHHYQLHNVTLVDEELNKTLLFAFYGYELGSQVLAQSLNLSFGVGEDGFYNSTRYTTWSLSVGYGQPPAEHLSLLVLLILGVGLGVPALLMAVGGLYLLVARGGRAKDELFLSR